MKKKWMGVIIIGFCSAGLAVAAEAPANFAGTWVLDKTDRSFTPTSGGDMDDPTGGRYPGGGYPGIGGGFPGGGGGLPGGGGNRRSGGYPGGGRAGRGGPEGGEGVEPEALTLDIQQSAEEIQITRKWNQNGENREVKQSFTLDGKENSNDAAMGGEFRSKTKIHKGAIILEGTQRGLGGRDVESKVKEEYSLSKNGDLTIRTSRQTSRGLLELKQTFKRAEQ